MESPWSFWLCSSKRSFKLSCFQPYFFWEMIHICSILLHQRPSHKTLNSWDTSLPPRTSSVLLICVGKLHQVNNFWAVLRSSLCMGNICQCHGRGALGPFSESSIASLAFFIHKPSGPLCASVSLSIKLTKKTPCTSPHFFFKLLCLPFTMAMNRCSQDKNHRVKIYKKRQSYSRHGFEHRLQSIWTGSVHVFCQNINTS